VGVALFEVFLPNIVLAKEGGSEEEVSHHRRLQASKQVFRRAAVRTIIENVLGCRRYAYSTLGGIAEGVLLQPLFQQLRFELALELHLDFHHFYRGQYVRIQHARRHAGVEQI